MRNANCIAVILTLACQCRSSVGSQPKSTAIPTASADSQPNIQSSQTSPVCESSGQIAYAVPLGNSQLNALAAARFCRRLGRRREIANWDRLEEQRIVTKPVLIPFLLGDSDPNRIVGIGNSLVGVLNPEREQVSGYVLGGAYGWLRLIEHNRLVGAGGAIELSSMTVVGSQGEIPNPVYFYDFEYVLGAYWRGDTLTALGYSEAQGHGPLIKPSFMRLMRARLEPMPAGNSRSWIISERPEILWHVDNPNWAAQSPFLSDGSVAVVREQEILWLSNAGKPIKSFPLQAIPARVSVGLDDTILAFEANDGGTRLHILGKDGTGQVDVGVRKPCQPALSLPDGRIVMITEESVVNILNGKISWEWRYDSHLPFDPKPRYRLPPDWNSPVATGTLDGCVVVRWEQQAVTLDPNGKVIWRMRTPDRILSNPLVTANGGVCVAIPDRVICEIP